MYHTTCQVIIGYLFVTQPHWNEMAVPVVMGDIRFGGRDVDVIVVAF